MQSRGRGRRTVVHTPCVLWDGLARPYRSALSRGRPFPVAGVRYRRWTHQGRRSRSSRSPLGVGFQLTRAVCGEWVGGCVTCVACVSCAACVAWYGKSGTRDMLGVRRGGNSRGFLAGIGRVGRVGPVSGYGVRCVRLRRRNGNFTIALKIVCYRASFAIGDGAQSRSPRLSRESQM